MRNLFSNSVQSLNISEFLHDAEALCGGLQQQRSAFKNFAKFTGKYLCWSIFLTACRISMFFSFKGTVMQIAQ